MALTAKQLALHAARALERNHSAVLAYAWHQAWNDSEQIEVNGSMVAVDCCESVLAVRERLSQEAGRAKILLVSVAESELGQDVLARIYGRRLLHIDRWQMVEDAFGIRQIDPKLYGLPWMTEALLEAPPPQADANGGLAVLTYDRAMELCLAPILGRANGGFELDDLVTSSQRASGTWKSLPEERRNVFAAFLRAHLGSVASAILGAMAAGQGHAVVSIGLACEVLYSDRSRGCTELRDCRVRLESYLSAHRLSEADGKQWAEAAERVTLAKSANERISIFQGAADLLRSLGADEYIIESSLLPVAFDLRLDELGAAIQQFLKLPSQLAAVVQAENWVGLHRLPPIDHPGIKAAAMALALCRREAELAGLQSAPSDLVLDYINNGAWEDYARRVLRGVRPEIFSRGVSLLVNRISDRRAVLDQKFAMQLAEHAGNASVPADTLAVESTLDELVVPLAQHVPVALIIVDGMSWDVYYGIAEEMARQGWEGRRFSNGPNTLLATVPSVTECSRTSLLCGRLARGNSATEKAGFSSLPRLLGVSRAGKQPILLHKAELAFENQLSEGAVRLLTDPEQQVVGVVLNAVDDALSKSDQIRSDWSVESIPLLGALLTQARLAGRAVVITSDHGHVLDSGSQYRAAGDFERWRSADQRATDGEIQIGGNRVRSLVNSEIVVPWNEKIRYGTKKNGYHGGVSRQEMLVPIGLWMPYTRMAPSYDLHQPSPPSWWDCTRMEAVVAVPGLRPRPDQKPKQPDLFAVKEDRSWIARLLASNVMGVQRERVGRIALDDDRLGRLLACLDQRGGRATINQLAAAVEQPALRMRGIVSAMQRMLNVDGYPVINMEAATSTVLLNHELLRKQFEL